MVIIEVLILTRCFFNSLSSSRMSSLRSSPLKIAINGDESKYADSTGHSSLYRILSSSSNGALNAVFSQPNSSLKAFLGSLELARVLSADHEFDTSRKILEKAENEAEASGYAGVA